MRHRYRLKTKRLTSLIKLIPPPQPETNTFLSNRGLTLTLKPDLKRWAQAGQKSISASLGGGESTGPIQQMS